MNILLTSNRFYPDIGGIETISNILADQFISAGHKVRIVTQSRGDKSSDMGFPFQVVRRPSSKQLLSSFRWADVVIQNNLEVRQLWPLLICRRPLIIGLQTWIRNKTGQRSLLQKFKLLALKTADAVIACSEAIRLDSDPKAEVIGNPYNSTLFQTIAGIPRKQGIVFVGRLVSDKGADMLIRSYAAMKPEGWSLSVVGEGPERSRLEELVNELRVAKDVEFVGALQGEALVKLLNQQEILVVPSRWREPFGVVALEGLACGCVVLVSNGGGLPDAVGHAGAVFNRNDQADLEAQLSRLLQDASLRQELRDLARSQLESFQQDVIGARYLSVIEKVSSKAGSSRNRAA
jgi:glycosyltransferase involved in cell wall biosynthesis